METGFQDTSKTLMAVSSFGESLRRVFSPPRRRPVIIYWAYRWDETVWAQLRNGRRPRIGTGCAGAATD